MVSRFAVAWMETATHYDPARIETGAVRRDGEYMLFGRKILVMGGGEADWLVVSAVIDRGIGLFLVPSAHPGVTCRGYRGMDGTQFADITLTDVRVGAGALLIEASGGLEALENALDHVRVAFCAALVGAMAAAVGLTSEYVRIRKQFGKSSSDFRVVQHQLVDMLIDSEQSRSMLLHGLAAVAKDQGARRRDISACMVYILEAMRKVAGLAVHQHGGIGHTHETAVSHYCCPAHVADKLFGDADYYLARFTAVAYA